MEMEYGKAVAYPSEDPDWLKKFGIAGLISIVPVVGQIVMMGYETEIMRRVINNEARPLPDWNDLGGFVVKGFSAVVIRLVYALPALVFGFCSAIPVVATSLMRASRNSPVMTTGIALTVCLACVTLSVGLLSAMLAQIGVARYASTGNLTAAFQLGEVWRLWRVKPGVYLISLLLIGLLGALLSTLGAVACGVGAAFGGAYATLAAGHLLGQAYRHVTAQGATQ